MTTEERLENLESELARTSRRNRHLLIGAAICLGVVFAWLLFTRPGRYALSSGMGGVYVLDTRTGQLWGRAIVEREARYNKAEGRTLDEWFGESHNYGTNENPKDELIKGGAYKVKAEP